MSDTPIQAAVRELRRLLIDGNMVTLTIMPQGEVAAAGDAPSPSPNNFEAERFIGEFATVATALPAFSLAQHVELAMSSERGQVIGLAHYLETEPRFYVRYVTADGRQAEDWFTDKALKEALPRQAEDADARRDYR